MIDWQLFYDRLNPYTLPKFLKLLRFSTRPVEYLQTQSIPRDYILAALCLVLASICSGLALMSGSYSSSNAHPVSAISPTIQALSTFVLPTSVAWPKDYGSLVKHYTSQHSKSITLQPSSIFKAFFDGFIELRTADFPDLFRNRLKTYGWHITLEVETSWQIYVLKWLLMSNFSSSVFVWLFSFSSWKTKNHPSFSQFQVNICAYLSTQITQSYSGRHLSVTKAEIFFRSGTTSLDPSPCLSKHVSGPSSRLDSPCAARIGSPQISRFPP